jgi:hypothetical protein
MALSTVALSTPAQARGTGHDLDTDLDAGALSTLQDLGEKPPLARDHSAGDATHELYGVLGVRERRARIG